MSRVQGIIDAVIGGQVVLNEYTLAVEALEDGYTLTIRNGSQQEALTLKGLGAADLEAIRAAIAAEQGRADAEQAREAAERDRETAWESIGGTIQQAMDARDAAQQAAQLASANAAEAVRQAAQQAAQSIPADYSALSRSVGRMDAELVRTTGKLALRGTPASANRLDPERIYVNCDLNLTTGEIKAPESATYSSFEIEVAPGDTLYFYELSGTTISNTGMRFVLPFDSEGGYLIDQRVTGETKTYTVPEGVARLRVQIYTKSFTNGARAMLIFNDATPPTDYEPFAEEASYYAATPEFLEGAGVEDRVFAAIMGERCRNLLDPAACQLGKYISYSGNVSDNASYFVSGYVPVRPGQTLRLFTRDLTPVMLRTVAAYTAEKIVSPDDGQSAERYAYVVPAGIYYVRFARNYNAAWTYCAPEDHMATAEETPARFQEYDGALYDYALKPEYLPAAAALHVYLPPEIPVGIGRTVELYNSLVCLEAEKYHLRWSGSGIVQYGRKVSIIGRTAGTRALTLQIFDDDMNLLWYGSTSVVTAANAIAAERRVLPIGDSLTNMKPWLAEVQRLSGGKIRFIGTRHRADQPDAPYHEGRSGFSAMDYVRDATYDFDNNYAGAGGVSGSANPFWNGERFSLAHYVEAQGATVGVPDAVQLFLGTNGIDMDPSENVASIAGMARRIREEYPSLPIFVCNTIYRSRQDGYYSAVADGYAGVGDWQLSADMKVMNLQRALAAELEGMAGVYIVPLSVCMDRDNDFGQVEKPVNPRLEGVTERVPAESVHPQEAGYLQMADVMYSSYVAHLK